jgi:hypothetical protein
MAAIEAPRGKPDRSCCPSLGRLGRVSASVAKAAGLVVVDAEANALKGKLEARKEH